MKCPNCGTMNSKGAKYCEKCGISLIAGNICPKCGHRNRPTALHCVECGTSLILPESSRLKQKEEISSEKKSSNKTRRISPLVWILGGIGGTILLCLAAFLFSLIRIPVPPQPDTSALPQFIVSAWEGAYNMQNRDSSAAVVSVTTQTNVPEQESISKTGNYVRVLFNCDEKGKGPVYATSNDELQDFIGWTAATQNQTTDFLRYLRFTTAVNEIPANYQGPFSNQVTFDQQKNQFYTSPLVILPALSVGTHHIRTEINWLQKIYDGEAYYGPGTPNEKIIGNCTVIIAPVSSNDGQKAILDNPNRVNVNICTPFLQKEDCAARKGVWTANIFTGEEFCTCNPQNPKDECIKNNGTWFEQKQYCSYLDVPFVVCAPFIEKDTCEAMDATWQVNNNTREGYCVCNKNDPQKECETYDGRWDNAIQRCSFNRGAIGDLGQIKTSCPDILNSPGGDNAADQKAWLKTCISRGGYQDNGNQLKNFCICPDAQTAQPTCNWINAGTVGNQINHSIDCTTFENRCSVKINYGEGFDNNEIGFQVVIKLKNGKTISSTRPGSPGMSLCQKWKPGQLSCELLNNETVYGYPEMKGADDVQDIYLCSSRCCIDLKKFESGVAPTFYLADNCPISADLYANVKEWKFNKMTMEISNKLGWSQSAITVNLKDSRGDDWSSLICTRKTDDEKTMVCTGTALGRTGTGSVSFDYGGAAGSCSISGLQFPIPCTTPCQGTCCMPGYRCCPCGCKLLSSGTTCSSACS